MKIRLNPKTLLGFGPKDLTRKWVKSVSFSLPVWRLKKLFTKKEKEKE